MGSRESGVMGEKWDDGKDKPSLIPWVGVEAAVKVAMYGLKKGYKKDSWKFVEGGRERYWEAFLRHTVKVCRGEHIDPESGLPHYWHSLWNLMAVAHFDAEASRVGGQDVLGPEDYAGYSVLVKEDISDEDKILFTKRVPGSVVFVGSDGNGVRNVQPGESE